MVYALWSVFHHVCYRVVSIWVVLRLCAARTCPCLWRVQGRSRARLVLGMLAQRRFVSDGGAKSLDGYQCFIGVGFVGMGIWIRDYQCVVGSLALSACQKCTRIMPKATQQSVHHIRP